MKYKQTEKSKYKIIDGQNIHRDVFVKSKGEILHHFYKWHISFNTFNWLEFSDDATVISTPDKRFEVWKLK